MHRHRAALRFATLCLSLAAALSPLTTIAAPVSVYAVQTHPSGTPSAAAALSPAQRGDLVRAFVTKWGHHVKRVYNVPVRTWAMRMVPTFVAADPTNLRNAMTRDTFEGAMAELTGKGLRLDDTRIARRLSASPVRGSAMEHASSKLGDLNQDLAYTPIQPCRIVDTRLTTAGQFAAAETRHFFAINSSFTQQGGSSTDCGMQGVGASAVVLNLAAVTPLANGYATVFPFGTTQPGTSNINYSTSITVANNTITKIPNPLASSDFSLYSSASAHYVIDIVGYFAPPQATALQCIQSGYFNQTTIQPSTFGVVAGTLCPNGYTRVTTSCSVSSNIVSLNSVAIGGCQAYNNGPVAETVYAESTCCRVPGR